MEECESPEQVIRKFAVSRIGLCVCMEFAFKFFAGHSLRGLSGGYNVLSLVSQGPL